MSNRGNCLLCDPRDCAPSYLYVMRDSRLGLTKIGCTKNVAARTAKYRANGATYMELIHKQIAGCQWTAMTREAKALRLLAGRSQRVRGDWFRCQPEVAQGCAEAACAGYSGSRWK